MHFIATKSPVLSTWALNTSLNDPSPNFWIILYSIEKQKNKNKFF
jgi:hypothetical protein